jgi:hypothetical protein
MPEPRDPAGVLSFPGFVRAAFGKRDVSESPCPVSGMRHPMQLETVSSKHLNDLEQLALELLHVLRKAGLHHEPFAKALQEFEDELSRTRRARFDATNSEYASY